MTIVLLCIFAFFPFIGLFVFFATSKEPQRREAEAMRAFAALLDDGGFTPGKGGKGPRATGRWRGRDVSVGFFGRFSPPVFLTTVAMSRRRPSPLAMVLVPRTVGPPSRREPPAPDAPEWIVALDRVYDAACAPRESFRVIMDESTAASLTKLEKTEVEVLPSNVNIQQREMLHDANLLVPLLDAAAQLASRLDALQSELTGPTEEDGLRRYAEVTKLLNAFKTPS